MRSRRDDVPVEHSVRHALAAGIVGMGAATEDRAERRLQRFARVDDGSYVWTLLPPSTFVLGRVTGSYVHDTSEPAAAVDLVNVRSCDWSATPVDGALVPEAVRATFARGGRNFQRIHAPGIGELTEHVWELISR